MLWMHCGLQCSPSGGEGRGRRVYVEQHRDGLSVAGLCRGEMGACGSAHHYWGVVLPLFIGHLFALGLFLSTIES